MTRPNVHLRLEENYDVDLNNRVGQSGMEKLWTRWGNLGYGRSNEGYVPIFV